MDALDNLIEIYNGCSSEKTEKVIAGWMLAHLHELPGLTIYDIAENASASRASVWRMVRSMGYASFPEFSRDLQNLVSRFGYHKRMLSVAGVQNTPESIRNSLLGHLETERTLFRDHLDVDYAMQITDAVQRAKRVHFYVMTTCMPNRVFQENLTYMGKECRVLQRLPDIMADIPQLGPDSLVFTNLLETMATLSIRDVFTGLKANGTKIVFFGTQENWYASFVDYDMQRLFGGHPDYREVYPENCLRYLAELHRITYVDRS